MPLVRISHVNDKTPAVRAAIASAIHDAMVETFAVPIDDRFQIVTGHDAGTSLIGPSTFLGIAHSDDLVFVQITCADGRTIDTKRALYARLAELVSQRAGIAPADVVINLVETRRENWSFGNGVAQLA